MEDEMLDPNAVPLIIFAGGAMLGAAAAVITRRIYEHRTR